MEKTLQNLKDAFAGESQTNRRYLAFAARAEEEGYPRVARLFRALAAAETVHAMNFLNALQVVKSTPENLQEALAGEMAAFEERYPVMGATARQEGHRQAEQSFTWAQGAEKSHGRLLEKAWKDPKAGLIADLFVCNLCGYVVEGAPPDTCPVCQATQPHFRRVD